MFLEVHLLDHKKQLNKMDRAPAQLGAQMTNTKTSVARESEQKGHVLT